MTDEQAVREAMADYKACAAATLQARSEYKQAELKFRVAMDAQTRAAKRLYELPPHGTWAR